MANNQEISKSFISLAKRRSSLHGRWIPAAFWSTKLDIKDSQLKKALENQGLVNCQLEDHGDLKIEFVGRKVLVNGKALTREFVCVTSPGNKEVDSMQSSKVFKGVLQAAWDQYIGEETTAAADDLDEMEQQQAEQNHNDNNQSMTGTGRQQEQSVSVGCTSKSSSLLWQ